MRSKVPRPPGTSLYVRRSRTRPYDAALRPAPAARLVEPSQRCVAARARQGRQRSASRRGGCVGAHVEARGRWPETRQAHRAGERRSSRSMARGRRWPSGASSSSRPMLPVEPDRVVGDGAGEKSGRSPGERAEARSRRDRHRQPSSAPGTCGEAESLRARAPDRRIGRRAARRSCWRRRSSPAGR